MKKIFIFLIIVVALIFGYYYFFSSKPDFLFLEDVLYDEGNMTEYTVYGKHLNIEGYLNEVLDYEKIELAFKNDEEEITYDLKTTVEDNKIYFKVADKLNEGIVLDSVSGNEYIILVKVTINENEVKYYGLDNKTDYSDLSYYSMSFNGDNKYLIKMDEYDIKKVSYDVLTLKKSLKDIETYDVVIDAGHGGVDAGAINGDYHESKLTLQYALKLKSKLESMGIKVKMTRDSDIFLNNYGEGGRAVIPNDVRAKYSFSIHLNSTPYKIKTGGVEVYAPDNLDYTLAESIAKNVVNIAKSNYSGNKTDLVKPGVYVKYLSDSDIDDSKKKAKQKNFAPYDIKKNTLYYYMIREPGGIMTNAYVDGRDKEQGGNKYYNSNYGVEAYLLELAFMSSNSDLNNFVSNMNLYVDAVALSIKEELKIN